MASLRVEEKRAVVCSQEGDGKGKTGVGRSIKKAKVVPFELLPNLPKPRVPTIDLGIAGLEAKNIQWVHEPWLELFNTQYIYVITYRSLALNCSVSKAALNYMYTCTWHSCHESYHIKGMRISNFLECYYTILLVFSDNPDVYVAIGILAIVTWD